MATDKEWKPPKLTPVIRHVAKQQLLHHPTQAMLRVYQVLDKLGKDYTPKGELLLDGYYYFPIALLHVPDYEVVVIDGRGRSSRGFEDTSQRIRADRFTAAMNEFHIPYLFGRNNWDLNYWEMNIRRLYTELEGGAIPQWTGTRQVRKSTKQAKKRRYVDEK